MYSILLKDNIKFFKKIGFYTFFIIFFSVFISSLVVLKYAEIAYLDTIELNESESEEVEETELDEFLQLSASLSNYNSLENQLYFNSTRNLFQNILEIHTPPPEISLC